MKQLVTCITLFMLFLPAVAQQKETKNIKDFTFFYNQYSKFRTEGKTDSIFFISKECLRLAQAEQNDSLLQKAYNLLGNAFKFSSDLAPALEYYFRSLALAEKMKNRYGISVVTVNICGTYAALENYSSGIDYGKRAINMLLSLPPGAGDDSIFSNNYYSNLAGTYEQLGYCFLGLNEPDSGLKYLQPAYTTVLQSKSNGSLYYKGRILTTLARTYELLKEERMAEDYYREAIYLSDSLQMQRVLGYTTNYYGSYLLKHGRLSEAKHWGSMGLAASIQSRDKINVIDIAGLLQHVYDAAGNTDSAYFFSKMINAYTDSVFNTQKMTAVQNTLLKRQIEEREELVKEEKQAEERKQNLQYAAIALGLLLFVIFFFLFSHSVIANQRLIRFLGILSLLIVFEFLNLLLHPYLEEFTHDQPLLMLTVMVGIAALLIPLHHKLEHWITHKLVEKNNAIRLAAAKKTIEKLEAKAGGKPG